MGAGALLGPMVSPKKRSKEHEEVRVDGAGKAKWSERSGNTRS